MKIFPFYIYNIFVYCNVNVDFFFEIMSSKFKKCLFIIKKYLKYVHIYYKYRALIFLY